jgi:phospholipid/cholesterol/gamma-HCH transport system substrate-binding protein
MSRTLRLGAFILSALIVFTVIVFWIGDRQFVFTRTFHINAPFDNVAGLDEGAPVRVGGVRVGTVQHIILPGQPGDKITVHMELQHSTRDVIKKDSVASIETEGLLGAKYAAISFGSSEAEAVEEGDFIQTQEPFDYGDLARNMGELITTTKEAVDSSKIAIGNINDASGDLKSITGKINSGKGTMGALVNDQSMYRNLNSTAAEAKAGATSFQENMEALKHNFFLRGFFKKRGYYDSSQLTSHAIDRLPDRAPAKQFTFDGKELFNKANTAKLSKQDRLNQVGTFLESNPFGLAVVVAETGATGEAENNQKIAQARAMLVRQYLAQKFKVDDSRIKTLGIGESKQTSNDGAVKVVIYPGAVNNRLVAKTKR